jgi:N4-gp56 family major capsid protein
MAMQTTTNPADVADRYQRYFSRQLLYHAVNSLKLHDYAAQRDLPKNAGATFIRFYRKRVADDSQVETLTEGVASSTFTEVSSSKIDVDLAQLGEKTKISDIRTWTEIFNWLQQSIGTMGEDAALKCDSVIRNAIVSDSTNGLKDIDGDGQERFCGVGTTGYTPGAASTVDYASLLGTGPASAKLTRVYGLMAATQLRVNKTPKIGGKYICILPPQIQHDVVQDPDWLDKAKFSTPEKLEKGVIGELDGVEYYEATNPFIEGAVYGTYNSSGSVYSALYFGRDAYGVVKLAGTSSPMKPSVTILKDADKSDPHNQFSIAAWKAYYAAVCLNTEFIVNVRAKSTFA